MARTSSGVTAIEDGNVRTVFFAETEGVPAQFAFETNGPDVEAIDGHLTRGPIVNVLSGMKPGTKVAARVRLADGSSVQIVVLKREDSLAIWKGNLQGHDRLFLTRAGLVLDGNNLRLTSSAPAELSVAKTIPVNGRLHNVYVTPDNQYVITGSIRTKVLTVIDLAAEKIAWELKLDEGVRPMAMERAADGSVRRIFVQLSNLNGFAVVDFASRKEVDRIKLPDNGYGVQERRLDSPSHGMGVAPDNKTLWVTSISANAVYAYALPELKLRGSVALPALKVEGRKPISAVPNWVTFTPDSKLLYVSNAAARSVSVIDTAAIKLVTTVPVGEVPKRINTLVLR